MAEQGDHGDSGDRTARQDDVPAYRTIRVTALEQPVAALADVEAWRARDTYPDIRFAGGPVFGVAREREEGGWELHPYFCGLTPQDARDSLGSHFRMLAREAERAGDGVAREAAAWAVERMDREPLDELTVRGDRYRVVRAERFIRTGPDGPEPPRPTDLDPGEVGRAREVPDPTAGFVVDPVNATGMSEGILKLELLGGLRPKDSVPPEVRADALRAAETHPGGVLLPATFMTAEYEEGRWRPESSGISTTPQDSRDGLALALRVMMPWQLGLGPEAQREYARAADRLDAERADELEVAGRRFRTVRVERLVRIGADGPEGPRPSDPDPDPPPGVHAEQLRAQGLLDDDEDEPLELDEQTQELARRFEEEALRRRKLLGEA
ncbi:DUF5954 family protein [Streptomyces sclerotialus]|uniref:DUF5954 family protein n=1 Tax=Streptomyces sclerotialus TaxID=1957 RepID=UPI0004C518F8